MINIKKILTLQLALDKRIESLHLDNYADREEVFDKKILALLVELGELANETRCFKCWSNNGPSPKERIAEEFADGLSFILSIMLDNFSIKYISDYILERDIKAFNDLDLDLTGKFVRIYKAVPDLNDTGFYKFAKYRNLLTSFLGLGLSLGLTFDEMEQAYIAKNKINHERQDVGY